MQCVNATRIKGLYARNSGTNTVVNTTTFQEIGEQASIIKTLQTLSAKTTEILQNTELHIGRVQPNIGYG
jgi:hypothetical protein